MYIVLLVNVIAVLAMPPALLFLYMLVNDREIMGELVSPLWANVLALGVVIILIGAGLLFGISGDRAQCSGDCWRQVDGKTI